MALLALGTCGLVGCSSDAADSATSSSGGTAYEETTEPAVNPYAGLSPSALADAELALAEHGGTCADLGLWYGANPGDSNPAIARHFHQQCSETPPPVASGELDMSAVTGGSTGSGATGGDAFLRDARGSDGSNWPFQPDERLLALGEHACTAMGKGASAQALADVLIEGDVGASPQEIYDLVNAASTNLC
jgi:hypothetical protein